MDQHVKNDYTKEIYNVISLQSNNLTRGVSQSGLAIYIKSIYLKAKEELRKLKFFTMKKYNLQKIL